MIWDRSPTGMLKGKSRDASMMAKKIHQPAIDVTNVKAPPAWEEEAQSLANGSTCHGGRCGVGIGKTYNDESPGSLGGHCVLGVLVGESEIPVCACEAAEGADE